MNLGAAGSPAVTLFRADETVGSPFACAGMRAGGVPPIRCNVMYGEIAKVI